MKLLLVGWLLAVMNIDAAKRFRHFRILEESKGKIELRFPDRLRILAVSYDFSDLILIDKNCGKRRNNCPSYCDSPRLSPIYCDFSCQQISPQLMYVLCPGYAQLMRFDGNASAMAKPRNESEWRWHTAGYRPVYGQRWDAVVWMTKMLNQNALEAGTFASIVSASGFDVRILDFTIGVFGLGPGPNGFVRQLAGIHRLPQSAMSLTLRSDICRHGCRHSRESRLRNERIFTIGGIDGSECADWVFMDTISPFKWVFPILAVDFMGTRINGEMLGTLSHSTEDLLMGEGMAREVVRSGVAETFHSAPDKWEFSTQCTEGSTPTLPPVVLHFQNSNITLTASTLLEQIYFRGSDRWCRLRTKVNRKHPHSNLRLWVFGTKILEEHCVALDYRRNRIGFGKKRQMAFPYN